MNIDLINGIFGIVGSLFVYRSIYSLYKDKQVRGIYWPVAIFFSVAACWSIYLFDQMGFYYSTICYIAYALGNVIWLSMAIRYRRN